jgi:hypothetical protein
MTEVSMVDTPKPPKPGIQCQDHKALVQRVDGLVNLLNEERRMREKSLDELKDEFKGARKDIVTLKVDMAKFGAVLSLLLIGIQVAIKFIP